MSRTRNSYDVAGNAKNGTGLAIAATQSGVGVSVSRHRALTTAATSPSIGPAVSIASATAASRSGWPEERTLSMNAFTTRWYAGLAAVARRTQSRAVIEQLLRQETRSHRQPVRFDLFACEHG